MKKLTKNDELNILEQFFGEMELPNDEIKERINRAFLLLDVYDRAFAIIRTERKLERGFDEDYLIEFLAREYADIFFDENTDDFIRDYAEQVILGIIETTYKHIDQPYYTSQERIIEIAETDTNGLMNAIKDSEMRAKGYKTKRWITMKDEKVRPTHIVADGQTQKIGTPFKVGMYEMNYPLDGSLGAGAEEICGCRCVCEYYK